MIEIALDSIGHGALNEQFGDAMVEVVRNTCDPNTDATTKRKLVIEMTFTPDKQDRTKCDLVTKVTTKLGPIRPLESMVIMGIDHNTGEIAAIEYSPTQMPLFAAPEVPAESDVEINTGGTISHLRMVATN